MRGLGHRHLSYARDVCGKLLGQAVLQYEVNLVVKHAYVRIGDVRSVCAQPVQCPKCGVLTSL
jgi:hypothetical protein